MKLITNTWIFFTLTSSLYAATNSVSGPIPASSSSELTLWELLQAGGWVMIPLWAASFVAMVLIIFYFVTLQGSRVATKEFKRLLGTMVSEKNFGGILEATRASPQILARVMEHVAEFIQNNPEADFSAVREVAQAEGTKQSAALNQQVTYLMDIGVLSPMLGLFGTVVGILQSFGSIASEATPMRTMMLAGGVSRALIATAAGLVIGIISMFFYSYFRGRVQGLISELETSATTLVAQIGLKIKK